MAFSVSCVIGFYMVAGKLGPTSVQWYSRRVHAYPSHVLSVVGLGLGAGGSWLGCGFGQASRVF